MSYTRDLTDKEWSIVEPLLLEYLLGKKRTCPLKWSYREIFNAVLYQLKNGCNWRDLPKDFPPCMSAIFNRSPILFKSLESRQPAPTNVQSSFNFIESNDG